MKNEVVISESVATAGSISRDHIVTNAKIVNGVIVPVETDKKLVKKHGEHGNIKVNGKTLKSTSAREYISEKRMRKITD